MACKFILSKNIVEGNAITLKKSDGSPILFPEWAYLGKGKFNRRDFSLHIVQQNSIVKSKNSLFSHFDMDEVYEPIVTYEVTNVKILAELQCTGSEMKCLD